MYAPPGVKTSARHARARHHEGMGARRSGRAEVHRQAGAGAEARRGAGAHRRGRDLRDRSGNHLARPARLDPGRHAVQQELDARPRIHGHRRGARTGRGRIPDRPARDGGDPCRLRPVQALPRRHVHRVPQLRPQLRRRRQGPPRQRLHHRRRLLRIPGQQHQHAGRDPRRDVGRGGDARRHRRHRDVRPDRARRAGRGRERGRHRPRPDRPARRRGRQGARRRSR